MKTILIVIIILNLCVNVYAKTYKVDDILENTFVLNQKTKFQLPKGDWILAEKIIRDISGVKFKKFTLIRLNNNQLMESISIYEWNTLGLVDIRYRDYVDEIIQSAMMNDRPNSCNDRSEYSILKFFAKGKTHNCYWVGHTNLKKKIFETEVFYISPTVPDARTFNSQYKKWLKKNQIILPNVGLYSEHSYFSRANKGIWTGLTHIVDPKILNAPVNKFVSELTSEYHRNNIERYPRFKKIIENWISISAKNHKNFENSVRVLERHKLKLDNLFVTKEILKKESHIEFIDQINRLNDLYKSGVLTKEEFEKAKKKILN